MSATLGKSIAVIWEEHTVGRPPDFPSVGFCCLDKLHKILPIPVALAMPVTSVHSEDSDRHLSQQASWETQRCFAAERLLHS